MDPEPWAAQGFGLDCARQLGLLRGQGGLGCEVRRRERLTVS